MDDKWCAGKIYSFLMLINFKIVLCACLVSSSAPQHTHTSSFASHTDAGGGRSVVALFSSVKQKKEKRQNFTYTIFIVKIHRFMVSGVIIRCDAWWLLLSQNGLSCARVVDIFAHVENSTMCDVSNVDAKNAVWFCETESTRYAVEQRTWLYFCVLCERSLF